ncbi:MAG: HPr family phosphocarrier protein [Pseudomonadota bacterium]
MPDTPRATQAQQTVTIINVKGLHARASAALSKVASDFDAEVHVSHRGLSANARSIMDLLLLAAAKGSRIELSAKGPEAAEAVTAVASLVAHGFGESDVPTPPGGAP